MLRRLALAGTATLLSLAAAAAGAEAYVRWAGIESAAWPSIAFVGAPPMGLPGVDYLPRGFRLTDDGFSTQAGVCRRDPGPGVRTLLALGDSTTVQSTAPDGRPVENDATWPLLLARQLGAGWQVCTVAEMGYHPSDLVAVLDAIGDRVAPTETVLLLCDNDFTEQRPRTVVSRRGVHVLATPPQKVSVWAWGWSRFLFDRSSAYRVASAAAAARTGEARWVQAAQPPRLSGDALRALGRLRPIAFHLPPLRDTWPRSGRVDQAAAEGGLTIETLPRPERPLELRREPHDEVHLNAAGHAWLAGIVAARLGGAAPDAAAGAGEQAK